MNVEMSVQEQNSSDPLDEEWTDVSSDSGENPVLMESQQSGGKCSSENSDRSAECLEQPDGKDAESMTEVLADEAADSSLLEDNGHNDAFHRDTMRCTDAASSGDDSSLSSRGGRCDQNLEGEESLDVADNESALQADYSQVGNELKLAPSPLHQPAVAEMRETNSFVAIRTTFFGQDNDHEMIAPRLSPDRMFRDVDSELLELSYRALGEQMLESQSLRPLEACEFHDEDGKKDPVGDDHTTGISGACELDDGDESREKVRRNSWMSRQSPERVDVVELRAEDREKQQTGTALSDSASSFVECDGASLDPDHSTKEEKKVCQPADEPNWQTTTGTSTALAVSSTAEEEDTADAKALDSCRGKDTCLLQMITSAWSSPLVRLVVSTLALLLLWRVLLRVTRMHAALLSARATTKTLERSIRSLRAEVLRSDAVRASIQHDLEVMRDNYQNLRAYLLSRVLSRGSRTRRVLY